LFSAKLTHSKGKVKGLDTRYSAAYMSQTRDQQHFAFSEVAADWHEPMVRSALVVWLFHTTRHIYL